MRSVDAAQCCAGDATGMAPVVAAEIAELLANLAATGEGGGIGLRAIPMTDADRAELEQLLGHGEVHAVLEAAGTSHVYETSFSGVWWIRHLDGEGRISSEEIAVTRVPPILASHPDDVAAAARRLAGELAASRAGIEAGSTTTESTTAIEEGAHA